MIALDILADLRSWVDKRGLLGLADWFAEGGLRIQEFTALIGVKDDGASLKQALDALDARRPSPYTGVPGLHNLRWILFAPELKNQVPGSSIDAPLSGAPAKALVLSFVFEGDADDALAALLERAPVESILLHCKGFRLDDDPATYLMKHRVKSGFMFRDLGPLRPPDRYTPDATIAEIADARELEQRFEDFYSDPANASDLRQEFLKQFGKGSFSFPLTRFERRVPDEARWARRASELISRLQGQAAREDPKDVMRRGVHAKAHGLIEANFEIAGAIPAKYRVGIFSNPGERFVAQLRPSNGAHTVGPDRARDARGLAISLEVPLGDGPGARSLDDFLPLAPQMPTDNRQDFVLMSHPVFFAPDIRSLAVLMSILAAKSRSTKLCRTVAFALGSGSTRQLLIAARTFTARVAHPLAASFHSATPYLLGEDYIVKYSVELDDRRRFDQLRRGQTQNFLSDALRESLTEEPIELGFYLHVLSTSVVPDASRSIRDVVEDATLDFAALGAEKVRVATIRIGPQDPSSRARLLRAEDWEFNPWHALKVHRPLGSLNRARLTIYRQSAAARKDAGLRSVSGALSTPPGGLFEAAE